MSLKVVVVLATLVVAMMSAINKPPGCSYTSGEFTCDYRSAIPLDANDFFPPPQRLVMQEVSGTFSSSNFINFDQVNKSNFDVNFASELSIYCTTGGGGLILLDATSFSGMGFYHEVRFINCEFISIPASAFANFGSVNYFSLEGGNLDGIDSDALLGLNVIKDTTLPNPKGIFAMIDVDLVPGGLPTGFLGNMTEAHGITISNSRMFTIDLNLLSNTVSAREVILDNNRFTYIPDNIFSAIHALGRVSMFGIAWECTCNNLWFLNHFDDKDILFTSAATCTLPSSHYGVSAYKYYTDVCDSSIKCDGGSMPAVNVGVACLTVLQIIIYVFSVFAFFFGIIALGIGIHTKRQLGDASGKGPKPGGGGPKRGGKNRVSQRPLAKNGK